MEIKAKITGLEEVSVALRHMAERVINGSKQQMERSGKKIVENAKNYCPEDKGNLVESIRMVKTYELNNRKQIIIIAGGVVNGVNVDQYAALIHEHYESILYGKDGKGPSDKTKEKMARFPGKVGSGFLTRAADEVEPRLRETLIALVKSQDLKQ